VTQKVILAKTGTAESQMMRAWQMASEAETGKS